jgi:hypothetical protein
MGKNTATAKRSDSSLFVYVDSVAIGRVVEKDGQKPQFCPFDCVSLNHERLYNLALLLKRIERGEE